VLDENFPDLGSLERNPQFPGQRFDLAVMNEAFKGLAFDIFWERHDGMAPCSCPRNPYQFIFDFSPNVRRRIYTTNAIESLNRDIRKATKTRASFPTETAAMKLLYLAVRKVEKRWLRPSPYWKAAMSELTIEFSGRLTPYLD
jgi:hypothetical protein